MRARGESARIASLDASRSDVDERDYQKELENKSSKEIGEQVGVSASTIDRVKVILEEGTPEQIDSLKKKNEQGEAPGIRTVYGEVQTNKLKNKLEEEQQKKCSQKTTRTRRKPRLHGLGGIHIGIEPHDYSSMDLASPNCHKSHQESI